jgi:hypothetical protein
MRKMIARSLKRTTLLLVLALAPVFFSCMPFRLQEARKGLEATLADLPQTGFTVISVIVFEPNGDTLSVDSMCYYDQAIVAVGSSLPEDDALASYVRELEAKGWLIQRSSGGYRELVRGEHESMGIHIGVPSRMLESDPDFRRRRGDFRSLVYLIIDYYLPSRAECMGEKRD